MDADEPTSGLQVQQQIDALKEQLTLNRGDIDALIERADAGHLRADASDVREETARLRADASEALADKDRLRIDDLEAHLDIDREMILELQDTGVLDRDQVVHLKEALRSSRTIGAAIGIIMNSRAVTQDEAFVMLKQASNSTNRKLRDLAEELVLTGDLAALS